MIPTMTAGDHRKTAGVVGLAIGLAPALGASSIDLCKDESGRDSPLRPRAG